MAEKTEQTQKKEKNSKVSKEQYPRMTSIARRLNMSFWLKRLGDTLFFDFLLAGALFGGFAYWCYSQGIAIDSPQARAMAAMAAEYAGPAACVLGGIQAVRLFWALFGTAAIRRKLKPLNDLAVKAEQMSNLSFDPGRTFDAGKFESLEHAIENVSPDGPEAAIHTGDKDLQSIEIALNNLLRHMKESQQQQARFVSDASHELRTPIAVVQGYVNLLDRWGKKDESVLEESIEALKHESQHMKELVEQLLFLARGDSGRNTLNRTDLDLNDIVREVWEESRMIDEKHVYVMQGCPGAFMNGDAAMLKQSVRIFVQNAAKYCQEGGEIRFAVKKDGHQVSYIIQDEGIGMKETEVAHIFERFYRSDEARNKESGGSGLGLSIAKWIIDAHDGVIQVLSRPQLGSRFTVSFPAK